MPNKISYHGFTLLEILVAVFIFTIVSVMTVTALHTVILTQTAMEKNTAQFNQLQIAMAIMQRDFQQGSMQHIHYFLKNHHWIRETYPGSHQRTLINHVSSAKFRYLDQNNQWQNNWPPNEISSAGSPKAIQIILSLENWGDISQFYLISGEHNEW